MSLAPNTQMGRRLVKRKAKKGPGFQQGTGGAAGAQSFNAGTGYAAGTPAPGTMAPNGPTGAPAAPAGPSPVPWDPNSDAQVIAINAGLGAGLAGLDQAEKFLKLDYGLIAQADGSFAVDISNPQAKAAMLQRHYQQVRRGDLNGMAARGQLTSGAYLRQLDTRNKGEQTDFAGLTRAFTGGLADIAGRRAGLQGQAGIDIAGVELAHAGDIGGDSQNTDTPAAAGSAKPKAGFQFVMRSGPRAGQSYKLVAGKGPNKGKLVRQYEDGHREAR